MIFLMSGVADPRNRSLRFPESHVTELEKEIDILEGSFQAEKKNVLYGGCELSARLDVACTVARRAERRFVKMKLVYGGDMAAMQYMNRLSDYLYILARYADYLDEYAKAEPVSVTSSTPMQKNHPECSCRIHEDENVIDKQNKEEEIRSLISELIEKLNL